MSYYVISREDYLMHHGIKGQKWGIRRYQNEDGSLTPEGMKRYGVSNISGKMSSKGTYRYYKDATKNLEQEFDNSHSSEDKNSYEYAKKKAQYIKENYEKTGRDYKKDRQEYLNEKRRIARVGLVATGASLAAIGTAAYVTASVAPQLAYDNAVKQQKIVENNYKKYYNEMDIDPDEFRKEIRKIDLIAIRDPDRAENEMKKLLNKTNLDKRFNDDTEDTIIPTGHKLSRITPNKNEAGQGYDMIYVNPDAKDAKVYKGLMGAGMARAGRDATKYERKMETTESIKAPSGQKMMGYAKNIFNKHPELKKDLFGSGYNESTELTEKEIAKALAVANQGIVTRKENPDSPVTKMAMMLVNEAKNDGYTALKDTNDIGKLGKSPLILFDPDSHTTEKKINKVGKIEQVINDIVMRAYTYDEVFGK